MNWKKNLTFIWLSQFLAVGGFSFVQPFIPFYFQKLGVTDQSTLSYYVGAFAAVGYLGVAVFAPIWGKLADRYGCKKMLLRANIACVLVFPVMAWTDSPLVLIALRLFLGIFAGTNSAAQAMVAVYTPGHRSGFALGLLSSALFGGILTGSMVGGIIVDHLGYTQSFYICALMFLISTLLVIFGTEECPDHLARMRSQAGGKRHSWKPSVLGVSVWLLVMLILFMGFSRRFDEPFLPLLVEDILKTSKDAASWTGIICGICALAGMSSGWVLGSLSDRIGAPAVAVLSTIGAGLLLLPQAFAHNLLLLTAARFLMVFCAGGIDPVFQIWLAKTTKAEQRGVVFGLASSSKCFGWMFAVMTAGAVSANFSVRMVFIAASISYVLLLVLIVVTIKKLRSVQE